MGYSVICLDDLDAISAYLIDISCSGTKGHVEHPYDRPWVATDVRNIETMADIVGALPSEIIYSSGLTTNLHILLQSFYRPTSSRFKIIYEFDAFNSDRVLEIKPICAHD